LLRRLTRGAGAQATCESLAAGAGPAPAPAPAPVPAAAHRLAAGVPLPPRKRGFLKRVFGRGRKSQPGSPRAVP
jgi:hypothetical protein